MKWQVSLNNNSFDRAGITKDCQDAVCEYIWNGFEAGATTVRVAFQGAPLREAMSLTVSDNGTGIKHCNLNDTFGAFLSSVKNNATIRIKSQSNKGKGRFSYLSFSSSAEWETVFDEDGQRKKYSINMSSAERSSFTTSDLTIESAATPTGTTVTFPIINSNVVEQLSFAKMKQKLLEEFAWYLHLNRNKKYSLEYMGINLDISEYINTDISTTSTETIDNENFMIDIVVWNSQVSTASKIYYILSNGEVVKVENTSFNNNQVGFYHAVFVSSEYFTSNMFFPEESEDAPPLFEDANSEKHRAILRTLKKAISGKVAEVLKSFLVLQADVQLAEMERKGSFPNFGKDEYGQLRKKDFQTVAKELYCVEPRIFHKLSDMQERSLLGFLNLLLSSDERENVLMIVEQIVSLTTEQRKTFANVLQRSKLQYIVEAIGIIERRAAVVEELKRIVFTAKKFANERDHIQKLIEQHFWLFGEQYHMLTADKNLTTSLQTFENITECDQNTDAPAMSEEDGRQRIDIFLYSQRIQDDSTSEMLIVELKAPYVKLTTDVFNQIVRYANTLRKEPRFNSKNRTWRFFTVCAEVDDDVKVKYENFKQYHKKGLADIIENFELYALSWDDVFQAFEAKHDFMLSKLKLDYSQVAADLGLGLEQLDSKDAVTDATNKILALSGQ